MVQQRNFNFFAFFSALYLVVSDILLTHTFRQLSYFFLRTHTHTQAQLTSKPTLFVLSYACVRRAVTLVNKGLLGEFPLFAVLCYFLNVNKSNIRKILLVVLNLLTSILISRIQVDFLHIYVLQIGVPFLWVLPVCIFCKCKGLVRI